MNFVHYKNGNYNVHIDLENGTKIRENDLDFFKPDYPESMDIKITNMCDMGCKFCHENSMPDGKHGDIMHLKFIDSLHPYTELAIGGGNPLAHPDLVRFLKKCKELKLIPSMTINQVHFLKNIDQVKYLVDNKLIYGLGISLTNPTDEFIEQVQKFPNAVIHVIAGIVDIEDLRKLANKNLKILLLGYKQFRRGEVLYNQVAAMIEKKIYMIRGDLKEIVSWFDVVSFDNLAIKQLEPKRILTDEEYDEFFMGEDGFANCYLDLVEQTYALSSVSPIRYPLLDDIKPMFEHLQEVKNI